MFCKSIKKISQRLPSALWLTLSVCSPSIVSMIGSRYENFKKIDAKLIVKLQFFNIILFTDAFEKCRVLLDRDERFPCQSVSVF